MADEAQGAQEATAKKTKKVNRLPKDQIAKKIDELEKAGQMKCKYYIHLQERLKETQN
jgi:hypothetical protein